MKKMRMEARTTNDPYLSNKIRNKKCTIMDCRGSEEEGFEYLIDVGKFPTLRMWLDEEYIDL